MQNKNEDLLIAETNLQLFLRDYPHMQEMQDRIDKVLSAAITPTQRLELLQDWIKDNCQESAEQFDLLSKKTKEFKGRLEKLEKIMEDIGNNDQKS